MVAYMKSTYKYLLFGKNFDDTASEKKLIKKRKIVYRKNKLGLILCLK